MQEIVGSMEQMDESTSRWPCFWHVSLGSRCQTGQPPPKKYTDKPNLPSQNKRQTHHLLPELCPHPMAAQVDLAVPEILVGLDTNNLRGGEPPGTISQHNTTGIHKENTKSLKPTLQRLECNRPQAFESQTLQVALALLMQRSPEHPREAQVCGSFVPGILEAIIARLKRAEMQLAQREFEVQDLKEREALVWG